MQSAAAESFVGGVDSPIDDVVSNQTSSGRSAPARPSLTTLLASSRRLIATRVRVKVKGKV